MTKELPAKGIFAVLKPEGISSYDVIRKLKYLLKEKKIGHAGTLDPLAEGVLVVGVGRDATKKLSELLKKEKEYLAKIELGKISATDDREGPIKKVKVFKKPSLEEIRKEVKELEGLIWQKPPKFSALKINGQRAYALARQGKNLKLKARKVEIKKIRILRYNWPKLKLKVVTGPGVYIRALARDLGKKLKTGGYLVKLERIRVGDYNKKQALKIFK